MSESTLIAHVDTNLVTRAQLAALPPVMATDTFKPVAHIELVETLEKALNRRDILVKREQFAVNKSGAKLFGTLDLSLNGVAGTCASLGIRTANDKSMSIQIIAGMRIFVCDNMCFNGDTVCVNRKHTSGLDLFEELDEAVSNYEQHYHILKLEIGSLKSLPLADDQVKNIIYDLFAQEAMPIRFFRDVAQEYFVPRHEDFSPRTAWSLLNAFTEVAKQMPMSTRIDATQEVSRYFSKLVQNYLTTF